MGQNTYNGTGGYFRKQSKWERDNDLKVTNHHQSRKEIKKKNLSSEELLKKIESGESLKDYVEPRINVEINDESLKETIKLMRSYNKK
tara:strand:- start:194 stop:457 length:264 start_codon:yes stop_codon:yes gene_type:complete